MARLRVDIEAYNPDGSRAVNQSRDGYTVGVAALAAVRLSDSRWYLVIRATGERITRYGEGLHSLSEARYTARVWAGLMTPGRAPHDASRVAHGAADARRYGL